MGSKLLLGSLNLLCRALDSSDSMILYFLTKVETRSTEQTGEDGSSVVGESLENNRAFPTPSARKGSEDPVSPVASLPATQHRSFRWGQHTLKG